MITLSNTVAQTVKEDVTMTFKSEEIVREFYAARMSRDAERLESTIDRLFADTIVWHYPGRNPLAQTYRGKEGVKTFFRTLVEISGGNFRVDIEDVVASEHNAVALELPQAIRKGEPYHWNAMLHYRVKDGKIQEVRVYQHTQYDLDEFWAELAGQGS